MGKGAKAADCAWMIPYITVKSAEAALDYYEKAFGFERTDTLPGPDGKIWHAAMKHQGEVILMLSPHGSMGFPVPPPGAKDMPFHFYVYTPDVDALYQQIARAGGCQFHMVPQDMFWGDRMMVLTDPDGYKWSFATKVREFDPSKVPACK